MVPKYRKAHKICLLDWSSQSSLANNLIYSHKVSDPPPPPPTILLCKTLQVRYSGIIVHTENAFGQNKITFRSKIGSQYIFYLVINFREVGRVVFPPLQDIIHFIKLNLIVQSNRTKSLITLAYFFYA